LDDDQNHDHLGHVACGVYSSSIATARIGLPVPPLIFSGIVAALGDQLQREGRDR
jgi:hypothetical protein